MKKIVCIFLAMVFIMCMISGVFAYSSTQYSIELPDTFKEDKEDEFKKSDGTTITVKMSKEKSGDVIDFSEKELDYFVDGVKQSFEGDKQNLIEELKKQYGNTISEEEIKEAVKDFKIDIQTKEISTVSKNNYKCFHILYYVTTGDITYYADQYSIVASDKFFTVTISAEKKDEIESEEIKGIMNSFTIFNYKAPKGSSTTKKTSSAKQRTISIIIVMIVGFILGAINRNRMKKV